MLLPLAFPGALGRFLDDTHDFRAVLQGIERLFGPEVKTGPYKHPACMTELENGDLYLVYYGGAGEYAVDTGVFGSRKLKGSKEWSPPRRIAHDPFRSVGNAVIWQAITIGSDSMIETL